jgi:hypothetical protein
METPLSFEEMPRALPILQNLPQTLSKLNGTPTTTLII